MFKPSEHTHLFGATLMLTIQPNPNSNTKRRVRLRVVGTVMSAAGPNMWNVSFDFDGKIKAVHSRSVKIVPDGTAIPVNELANNNNGK